MFGQLYLQTGIRLSILEPQGLARAHKILLDLRHKQPVEIASVPLRPRTGSSTIHPANKAPGTPITLRITSYKYELS